MMKTIVKLKDKLINFFLAKRELRKKTLMLELKQDIIKHQEHMLELMTYSTHNLFKLCSLYKENASESLYSYQNKSKQTHYTDQIQALLQDATDCRDELPNIYIKLAILGDNYYED